MPPDAVLLLDGVFLLRPELVALFDLSIHVRIGWDEVVRRGVLRDAVRLGSAEEAERLYRVWYVPAQRLYVEQARPADGADFVVDNDDPAAPMLVEHRLRQERSPDSGSGGVPGPRSSFPTRSGCLSRRST